MEEIKEMRILYGQICEAVDALDKIELGTLADKHLSVEYRDGLRICFAEMYEIQCEMYYQLQEAENTFIAMEKHFKSKMP